MAACLPCIPLTLPLPATATHRALVPQQECSWGPGGDLGPGLT